MEQYTWTHTCTHTLDESGGTFVFENYRQSCAVNSVEQIFLLLLQTFAANHLVINVIWNYALNIWVRL